MRSVGGYLLPWDGCLRERDSAKVELAGVLQIMSKQHQLFIDFR